MADLDDFFKKKDKKKKGEKKFAKANTDVLAKNLEVMDEKEEKALVKEIAEMNNDNPGTTLNQQDDDEWDDYRENKKDYTGLKIENLTVQETKTEEEEEEETEVDEDGEVVKKNKDGSGPWNRGEGSHQNSVEEREEVMPEHKREAVELLATSNVVGGSYVPPHMRGQPGGGASPAPVERKQPRGRMMKAPDISSELYFPSLGDASDTAPKGAWGKRLVKDEGAFMEVRGGEKQGSHRATEGPKLTLGNKFDVLGAE